MTHESERLYDMAALVLYIAKRCIYLRNGCQFAKSALWLSVKVPSVNIRDDGTVSYQAAPTFILFSFTII